MKKVTDVQAMVALENMDDYARMADIEPIGAYKTLREFILQHATTEGIADMTYQQLESAT